MAITYFPGIPVGQMPNLRQAAEVEVLNADRYGPSLTGNEVLLHLNYSTDPLMIGHLDYREDSNPAEVCAALDDLLATAGWRRRTGPLGGWAVCKSSIGAKVETVEQCDCRTDLVTGRTNTDFCVFHCEKATA